MKTLPLIAWTLLLLAAALLRFADLGSRPLHADEATGARIAAKAMESGEFRFDPLHYHGPTLHRSGQVFAMASGARDWASLEIAPLRAVTALAGLLICALPLWGVRKFGHGPMWLAAALLAASPLMAYYSRMFIHEILLVLCGLAALGQAVLSKRFWPAGLWLGLMFATKESFVISLLAWTPAAVITWAAAGEKRMPAREILRRYGRDFGIATIAGLVLAMAFYTDAFRHWQGAVDAVRTYFVYDTVDGHDKPFGWHFELLGIPEKRGGLWWWEGGILIMAVVALAGSFRRDAMPEQARHAVRFLALSFAGHLLIYSLFAYKTPWLMLLPWAHVCLLAGFAATLKVFQSSRGRLILAAASAVLIAWLGLQSWRACFRFPSEDRNRYAYVPTSPDLRDIDAWIAEIDASQPELSIEPIGVIGAENYWPLPWYLRKYKLVGYWAEPPPSLERLPLVFATSDLTDTLSATHVPIPRGLRSGVMVTVWIRQDFWRSFVGAGS